MSQHARLFLLFFFFYIFLFVSPHQAPADNSDKCFRTTDRTPEHRNVSSCDLVYKMFRFKGLDFVLYLIGSEIYHCV